MSRTRALRSCPCALAEEVTQLLPGRSAERGSAKKSNPELQYIEWEYLIVPFVYWKLDKRPFSVMRVR